MLSYLYDDDDKTSPVQSSCADVMIVKAELQLYLDDKKEFEDLLEFYRFHYNHARFWRISHLDEELLSTPATTECIFRISGTLLANRPLKTVDKNFWNLSVM